MKRMRAPVIIAHTNICKETGIIFTRGTNGTVCDMEIGRVYRGNI